MKRHFSSFDRYTIAEAVIDEAQINGRGDHFAPTLMLVLHLNIAHNSIPATESVQFRSLTAKLCLSQNQAFSTARAEVNILVSKSYPVTTHAVYLDFPLDTARLAALEKFRNGENLKLRIEAALQADQFILLNSSRSQNEPPAWAFQQAHTLHLQEDLVILRDAWITRVLPHVGYGVVHTLEFPAASLTASAALKHSFDALTQAQELHKIGLYDDAAGKCRVALDPFFAPVEEIDDKGIIRKVPRLKTSWEEKLGKATFVWLEGALNALKYAGNPSHHSPNARYGQMESQMILTVAAAVMAYAARVTEFQQK
jgi:hypothetical protein